MARAEVHEGEGGCKVQMSLGSWYLRWALINKK
jgi:hypothetical protein